MVFFPLMKKLSLILNLQIEIPISIKLVEAYAKAQGLWHGKEPLFTDTLILNLEDVEPSLAGPKRPQDKILLKNSWLLPNLLSPKMRNDDGKVTRVPVEGRSYTLAHGDVVIAAITSCTNTSNPSVMVGAGLLARKAIQKGLKI